MKRLFACVLAASIMLHCAAPAFAKENNIMPEEPAQATIAPRVIEAEAALAAAMDITQNLPAKSAVLIEGESGKVIFAKDENLPLPLASVTKVMALLLVMEGIEMGNLALTDMVTCTDYAAGMGGSQIWLEQGEQMTVDQLLKATAIASANDATVALAEHIAGSEAAFVELMNKRATELGMANTCFKNATGLDTPGHVSSAYDIAIMSKALIAYPLITQYSTTWMDSLRGGNTQLVNTNRLVRFYQGATGLKTGTTANAGSCLTATATRGELTLIAVVMGCDTSDNRFAAARALLDHGFANYAKIQPPLVQSQLQPVTVERGVLRSIIPVAQPPSGFVLRKDQKDKIQQTIELPQHLVAPLEQGQVIGKVVVSIEGEVIGEYPITAPCAVDKMTLLKALQILTKALAFTG